VTGQVRRRRVRVEGYAVSYQEAGPDDGPVLVLLHGLASDSTTWQPALEWLPAHGIRVLAPDLLGHGESDKPLEAGYLLADYADRLYQFLTVLGHHRATLAGHSYGGAVAMQCALQYPAMMDGLVLVASGGLGRQVTLALRAATLPGAGAVVRLATSDRLSALLRAVGAHRRISPEALVNLSRAGATLRPPAGRAAFLTTLRGVIHIGGQRGSLVGLLRLADGMPILLIWAAGDRVIPVSHAHALCEQLPGSRLELFPGATHEPHRRYPERFARVVAEFMAESSAEPAH
jgi:pimeloyl-ACP methyl ester carboxylesterase